jgi:hypothetical protein
MPHVKNWIRDNGTEWLPRLVDVYKVNAVTAGDLVSLKYDQIESPMHEPIVQECRGMVVHVPTGRILAHPYNKFWNLGETLAAAIDWGTARVQEKLDGSLMTLYWNHDEERWSVASSGQPVAGGAYGAESGRTFADAFWDVFNRSGMLEPESPDQCYMFELCAPDNRIVVKYDAPRLVLHGARNLRTEKEPCRGWLEQAARSVRWELVNEHSVADAAAATDAAAALDPTRQEGFVVVDGGFNRVKIKSPRYVALHHLRGNGASNRRRSIDLWKAGEVGELLAHFPEMAPEVQPVLDALDKAAIAAYKDLRTHCSLPTRKDFALAVKDRPWSAVVFKLYGDAAPSYEAAAGVLRSMPTVALERMVDLMLGPS